MIQTRDVQYVAAIAEAGSFSGAAEKLFITQPALSQAVARLEESLGVKLFRRESNPVSLTAAGEIFLEDGYTMLRLADTMQKRMTDIQGMRTGKLSIGISQFYGRYYFSRVIPAFHRMYPGIELNLVEETSSVLETMILKGKLDFSVFSLPVSSPNILYEPIFQEKILFAIPKDHHIAGTLAHRKGRLPQADLRMFSEDGFVMIKEGQRLRTISMDYCKQAGFYPRIIFETRSSETVNAYIAGGMGVGFVPDAVRLITPPRHQAFYCDIAEMDTTRSFVAGYHKNSYLSDAAKAFIAFTKEQASGKHPVEAK